MSERYEPAERIEYTITREEIDELLAKANAIMKTTPAGRHWTKREAASIELNANFIALKLRRIRRRAHVYHYR